MDADAFAPQIAQGGIHAGSERGTPEEKARLAEEHVEAQIQALAPELPLPARPAKSVTSCAELAIARGRGPDALA